MLKFPIYTSGRHRATSSFIWSIVSGDGKNVSPIYSLLAQGWTDFLAQGPYWLFKTWQMGRASIRWIECLCDDKIFSSPLLIKHLVLTVDFSFLWSTHCYRRAQCMSAGRGVCRKRERGGGLSPKERDMIVFVEKKKIQEHSDILRSFGDYHWDKDELVQIQIYHSVEKYNIIIYINAKSCVNSYFLYF